MDNDSIQRLCLQLLHADSEVEVIDILKRAGYWDDPTVWRLYGDREGNFATIGNQQSRPEAALVEKIVNSVDARLMNVCMERGIDPASSAAPQEIRKAVEQFFPSHKGSLKDWSAKARRDEAENITLAATGEKRHPCLTIADRGEGQTPRRLPETFMSIDRSNKLRINFVQGKFNMGGTGVLKFCGENRFQLVITRRNPNILNESEKRDPTSGHWAFTITRREEPQAGAGAVRNSIFTYLAPVCDGSDKNVLSFVADTLPLMPRYNDPYVTEIPYGSALKLYNYDMKGFSSNMLMKDGLLYRLEVLLPEIGLPVNLHECRAFGGTKEKSFVTPLAGLVVRLDEGKGGNVEEGFPDSVVFHAGGEDLTARIYAFKKGKAETYTTNEGVVFTFNGQTQGVMPKSIFSRNKVKLGRLSDSLLVLVDCSNMSMKARENLFMNSRDRLSNHEIRKDIESEIEEILGKHPKLKELANQRQAAEAAERLADSKPLEEVLEAIFKSSPSLNALFRTGQRLSSPYNRIPGGTEGESNGKGRTPGKGDGPGDLPFAGKPHPTFFRFVQKKDGALLLRNAEYGRRCRLTFETDAENQYFTRNDNRGWYEAEVVEWSGGDHSSLDIQHSLILHDGLGHWSVSLPDEIEEGHHLTIQMTVADEVYPDGFVNVAKLTIVPAAEKPSKSSSNRNKSTTGGGGEQPSGIDLPIPVPVEESEWSAHGFDQYSACKPVQETDGSHTFYINVDNLYLKHEIKSSTGTAELLRAKFLYGHVLVGLALIHDHKQMQKNQSNGDSEDVETIEDKVVRVTRAVSPFLIPMITYLGGLTEADMAGGARAGDDE